MLPQMYMDSLSSRTAAVREVYRVGIILDNSTPDFGREVCAFLSCPILSPYLCACSFMLVKPPHVQQLRYSYCLACEYVKTTFSKNSAIQFVTNSINAVTNNPGVVVAAKWLIETGGVVAIIGALTSEDCELLSAAFGSSLVCL